MSSLDPWQWAVIFVLGSAALVRAGITLAKSGDEIATRTGLGGLFIGTLLVAGATSLPEIVTVASAAIARAPDIAVGSLFGSSMSNMAILAVIDLVHRRHVWTSAELGHVRVGALAIALTAIAAVGVATPAGLTIGWVGADTMLIVVGYAGIVAWIRRSPRPARVTPDSFPAPTEWGEAEHPRGELRSAVRRFAVGAAVIFVAGPVVAISADGLAKTSGISETFVGVLLVAVATSLPELAGSVGAVRIGAYDLAVGNLFGSNAFNMIILFAADIAYVRGPILSSVDPAQVVAGIAAMGLMALALAAIVHGEETRIARLEPDAVLLLAAYLAALAAVWAATT